MDYALGYRAGYTLCYVDEMGADSTTIGSVSTASLTKSIDGDAPAIDSASLELDVASPSEIPDEGRKVRLYLNATSASDYARTPLFTTIVNDVSIRHAVAGHIVCSVTLRSVLGAMEDAKLDAGWYCPKGADGAQAADELLRKTYDGSVAISIAQGARPLLADNYVAANDESYLKASWGVLRDTWQLTLTEMGNIVLRPSTSDDVRLIRKGVICSDISEKSTEKDGEVTHTLDYTREYDPNIKIGDTVSVEEFDGVWRVMSQRYTCGCGVTIAETVKEV